jgi:lysophospholipase L1-like esterase
MHRFFLCAALLGAGPLWAQAGTPATAQPATTQTQPAPVQAQPTTVQTQPAIIPAPPDAKQIEHMQAQLADWPNLERYRAANAALPAPAAGEQRVVFMGDSITDGWGRQPDTGEFFPGKPYINRGISGQTTPQMLVRFQQDVVDLHPAVVVILAGTNDVAGNTGPSTPQMIEDNFTSMADIAKQSGIKVVLASITPAYAYPWRPGVHPVEEIRALNQWLREFCSSNGYVYLDYYDSMADDKGAMLPGYAKDGVHPTAKGYAVMAPLAEQAIAQALAR